MTIITGDCLDVMRSMADNSISCIVTDPPYGLGFMGKEWDAGLPHHEIWKEALRIVKPGGHLLAFGGTRTYHRLTCAIEDSGWEIRDCLQYIYGSGFPKSHNHFGIEGYGTALKPAHEPIIMCSKPYEINDILGIILLDLTEELYQWQKLNLNVNVAVQSLSDSQAWLSKELKHIALESVKISELEKLFDASLATKNATFPWQEWSEKTNREKGFFARTSARVDGRAENSKEIKILHGEEAAIFAAIRDIAISVTTEHIEQNIGLLWSLILAGLCQGASRFTTKTAINLITELRILRSCLSRIISKNTGNFSPDYEPIIMAMKPCDGTFAQNAEKWGQAGINIDGCRIGLDGATKRSNQSDYPKNENGTEDRSKHWARVGHNIENLSKGRWPANILFDEEAAKMLDEQSGNLKSGSRTKDYINLGSIKAGHSGKKIQNTRCEFSEGGASRFFYCAKASSRERNEGLEGRPLKNLAESNKWTDVDYRKGSGEVTARGHQNNHPTVKPLKLMEYLITLVMPPKDGILLDPFAGSGTTILAAKRLGFEAIGIEKCEEYAEIARVRLAHTEGLEENPQMDLFETSQKTEKVI